MAVSSPLMNYIDVVSTIISHDTIPCSDERLQSIQLLFRAARSSWRTPLHTHTELDLTQISATDLYTLIDTITPMKPIAATKGQEKSIMEWCQKIECIVYGHVVTAQKDRVFHQTESIHTTCYKSCIDTLNALMTCNSGCLRIHYTPYEIATQPLELLLQGTSEGLIQRIQQRKDEMDKIVIQSMGEKGEVCPNCNNKSVFISTRVERSADEPENVYKTCSEETCTFEKRIG